MPLGEALIRILLKALVICADLDFDPGRFAVEHHECSFGWHGQFGIDGGSKGMHQVWPSRIIAPQRAGTVLTKVPLPGTLSPIDDGMIDARVFLAFNREGIKLSTQIYGVAASACCLTAYRAITVVVRVRLRTIDLKLYRTTMT